MNGSNHHAVVGLKLGDLSESPGESSALSPVAGKQIASNGFDDASSTTVVLPSASRRTTENKVIKPGFHSNAIACVACVVHFLRGGKLRVVKKLCL